MVAVNGGMIPQVWDILTSGPLLPYVGEGRRAQLVPGSILFGESRKSRGMPFSRYFRWDKKEANHEWQI